MPHHNAQSLRPFKRAHVPARSTPAPSPSPSNVATRGGVARRRSTEQDLYAMDVDVEKLVAEVIQQTEAASRSVPFPASNLDSLPKTQRHSIGEAGHPGTRTLKRSRTTALLPPPSSKRTRIPTPNVSTSSAASPSPNAKRQRTVADPFTDASSTINSSRVANDRQKEVVRQQSLPKSNIHTSRSSNLASSPVRPDTAVESPSKPRSELRGNLTLRPGASLLLRHKRPTAGDIQTLIFLYRSLVYGLQVLHTRTISGFSLYALPDPTSLDGLPSHGPLFDNSLARRLRAYLLYLKVDRGILDVEMNSIREEVLQFGRPGQLFMDVEDPHFAHPYLSSFTNCSVLAYPQLVAMLTMRHRAKIQRTRTPRDLYRRPNKSNPSPLHTSFVPPS